MSPIRGSCLCGGIAYLVTGPLTSALNCHCSMCRKAHGAAFRTRARVAAGDFRWEKGSELLNYYESSAGTHRGFCRIYGTPLSSRFDFEPAFLGLPLGALALSAAMNAPRPHRLTPPLLLPPDSHL
ncbi:GFA family protein [Pollutimonas bauzanensis]|uniref:GFA family protein n=1 Tax=Pollutimonas bauzanensis TaxID=658167 RepID=UPI000A016B4B|nr:GFA family protein [Pollutimonas bauzanensis]